MCCVVAVVLRGVVGAVFGVVAVVGAGVLVVFVVVVVGVFGVVVVGVVFCVGIVVVVGVGVVVGVAVVGVVFEVGVVVVGVVFGVGVVVGGVVFGVGVVLVSSEAPHGEQTMSGVTAQISTMPRGISSWHDGAYQSSSSTPLTRREPFSPLHFSLSSGWRVKQRSAV